MTANLEPVYGWKPLVFIDHTKSGGGADVYMPDIDDMVADSDALTYKGAALWVAPTEGARITQIRIVNPEAATAYTCDIYIGTGRSAKTWIGRVNVPLKAGTDGLVPAVNGLSASLFPDLPRDNAGNPYMELMEGQTVFLIASTASKIRGMVTILQYSA